MHSSGGALRLATVILALSLLSACNDEGSFLPTLPDPGGGGGGGGGVTPTVEVTQYLQTVDISPTAGTYVQQPHPSGTANGPSILGTSTFVRGASLVMEVTVDSTATELYVGVSNANLGYYQFNLSALPTIEEYSGSAVPMGRGYVEKLASVGGGAPIAAMVAANTYLVELLPVDSPTIRGFTIIMSTGDGTTITNTRRHIVSVNSTAAASDKLQVSLNWIHPVDLDLHVTTPSGTEIYFANRTGPAGGTLDLDSNAACSIDNINNENITWAGTDPPAGEYIITLDLWSECTITEDMPWIVTVVVAGTPRTFSGSFSPSNLNDPLLEITRVTIP
jgi:hypothetical protein